MQTLSRHQLITISAKSNYSRDLQIEAFETYLEAQPQKMQ
jgi:hypothetical protein